MIRCYVVSPCRRFSLHAKEMLVNRIVYIVGAIVIIVALPSFFGLGIALPLIAKRRGLFFLAA